VAKTTRKLKPIAGLSGDLPVFDSGLLETLRWAAVHYVAPVAALLPRSAPPNLPRLGEPRVESRESRVEISGDLAPSPLPEASAAAAAGKRIRPQYLVQTSMTPPALSALAGGALEAERSVVVVAPTVTEAGSLATAMQEVFGDRVRLATSALPSRDVTDAWVRARTLAGTLTVGTREVAFWPVAGLGMVVVLEEGRRAMKAPQTPTTHVREIVRRRAAVERFQLVLTGPVPTGEVVAAGVDIHEAPGRGWPIVEVVDRTEEPPGAGLVTERVRRALVLSARSGKRAFVLVHRRGYAPAFRCVQCRSVRRCQVCGAAADRSDTCRRCGRSMGVCSQCGGARFEPLGTGVGRAVEDLGRSLGDDVGAAGESDRPVVVGTERDLPGAGAVDLAVAMDADGLMLAPHYRAGEDALRLLARLAGKVRPGRGNRCVIQTGMPDHEVIEAMRRGHPMPFLRDELRRREAEGFPPAGELLVVDVGGAADSVDAEIRDATTASVLGPADSGDRSRWLIQGRDLRETKIRLRSLVQKWRDSGARVRVDVDPLDL
jgi:primosomal protein N' (replication factor Y)